MSDGSSIRRSQGGARSGEGLGGRVVTGVLVAALAGLLLYKAINEDRGPGLERGQPAPELWEEKLGGGELALEELRGKVVMLDFWASWCGPCVQEMPLLMKVAREYEQQGVVLVAANNIEEDSEEAVRQFLARLSPLPPNAHVLLAKRQAFRNFQVEAMPTLYLIDREGKVHRVVRGAIDEAAIRRHVESALGL